jgi:hypothetical protein
MSGGQTRQCWCGALLGTKGHPEPHAEPPPVPGPKVRVPRGMPANPHVFYPGLNQPGQPAAAHSHAEHEHAPATKPAPPPTKGKSR